MTDIKSGWELRIPRDEALRFQYRVRPYLGNASDAELKARLDDILRNIYCFTPFGKIGPLPPDSGGTLWMQRLVDLQVELARRGVNIEGFGEFEKMPWNKRALELMDKNSAIAPHMRRAGIFCKYGDKQWLRLTREEGKIRLSPASYYQGNEHNVARQDDELALRTYVSPYDYDLGFIPDAMLAQLPSRGWGTIDEHKPSDHLIYCVTVRFDFRYFFDFGVWPEPAEASLVIHDQDAFEQRLLAAAAERLQGWWIKFDGVRYVDPYTVVSMIGCAGDDMFFFKPYRYMYQGEHRLIAVPPADYGLALTHLTLDLGPLTNISELVTLER